MSTSWIDNLSRRTRRVIAVATLLGLPAMYGWSSFWLSTDLPRLVWYSVSFLFIGITAVGSLVLYRFVQDRASMPGRGLDERQVKVRDQALVLSYGVLSTVVVIGMGIVAVLVLGLGRDLNLDGNVVGAVALCVGVLIPVLPVAALAWLEPDAPVES